MSLDPHHTINNTRQGPKLKKLSGPKFATSYENLVATLNSHSSLKKVTERQQYLVQYKCETVTVFQSAIGPTDLTQNSKN